MEANGEEAGAVPPGVDVFVDGVVWGAELLVAVVGAAGVDAAGVAGYKNQSLVWISSGQEVKRERVSV